MFAKNYLSKVVLALVVLATVLALALTAAGCSSTATTTTTPVATTPTATAPASTSAPATSTQLPTSTTVPPTSTPAASATPTISATPTASATVPKPPILQLLMASTTSTRDSGILDVLLPIFQKQTGYEVKPNFVGSGAAMALGQAGNADVLFVHSPDAEVAFMQAGYGIDRRLVMHNYFVIVGPASDPAKIFGMTDAAAAFKKIADSKALFYSRGDASGTDAAEKAIWAKVGVTVKDGSSTNPSWYVEGGAGTGMLALLQIAAEKNGYTLSDMATWLFNKAKLSLTLDVQGDPALINVYHVISVNPQRYNNLNILGARAFADFVTSRETQEFIGTYGVAQYGQSLFIPDFGKTEASLGTK
jgi:tungstate transport system substrate-binding protein